MIPPQPEARLVQQAPHAPTPPVWSFWLPQIRQHLQTQGWHPSRVVVLVPYAQMMEAGRRAWLATTPSGFPPRFESTRNWAASLQPFAPGVHDLSGDTARDSLVAAAWVDRVAGRGLDPDLRATLVTRLLEAARQLAPVAAAQPPQSRAAWAQALREGWAVPGQTLHWEALIASLSLTWAGLSAYATDVLWSPMAEPGVAADGLLVVPGFQDDPLEQALLDHWGARGLRLDGPLPSAPVGVALHPGDDAEDEAQRAAACVLQALRADRQPVALVAQDRALTRRVGALLHGAGVSVRDETGWKLSTTHAAARLMSLLRAADRRARTDEVLDWLKPGRWAVAADALERQARTHGLAAWGALLQHPATALLAPPEAVALLAGLQSTRPLAHWLRDLAAALRQDGWWDACGDDAAGQRVIEVLRLQDGAAHELAALLDEAGGTGARAGSGADRRWPLSAFSAWVRDALEAASFQPPGTDPPQVVILPMAQLLGRTFGAVVAPGCDEVNLPSSVEPPGQWSAPQRQQLGLPGREALTRAAQAAWNHLLTQPHLQLLWRRQQQGEAVSAAAWLQALRPDQAQAAADPREAQTVVPLPEADPAPTAADLLPTALSASAYQDLRDCPYRFFALRQLRLQEADEIEAEPDKRDLGNWLHAVLKRFHEARREGVDDSLDDRQRLDALAEDEARARGLSPDTGEGSAAFLPYLAAWPALREGYLAWLVGHEAAGPRFERAEVSISRSVGRWRLVGQLDRIDRQDSPEGSIPLVIDYKTEPRQTTLERVKNPAEDTQIAFYAALLAEETVRGAYLSITDSRESEGPAAATRWVEQTEIAVAREQLLAGIEHDLSRIAAGHALPPLGEGKVCDFCAARGLCRKDFRA